MIPERVFVRNFLCYDEAAPGEPIEFDFDGSPLWSISGDNGAGKSAIFDAITYTLFGQHRGGAQEDSRLIRKGAADCETAFEFRQNGSRFRVRRTVGRKQGKATVEPKTWQAAWFDPEFEDWRPVSGTESKAGLERWVRERLGFGYKTFTASVLLLQGQSDQLILAPPKERFDILSGLLDLEPYRRLEAAAQERAKVAKSQSQGLEGQLSALPPVTPEELREAEAAVKKMAVALEEAQAAAGQAEVALSDARRYADLQGELAASQEALGAVEGLLGDAARIGREYEEWRGLASALPKLKAAVDDLAAAAKAAAVAAEARAAAEGIDVAGAKKASEDAASAEKAADERWASLQEEHRSLVEALPPLRLVLERRRELAERQDGLARHGAADSWRVEVDRLERELAAREGAKRRADAAREVSVQAEAGTAVAVRQAEEQLTARREAQDEAVCSRCGQRVDPEHIQRELAEAQVAVAAAGKELEGARRARSAADEVAAGAAARLKEAEQALTAARQGLAAAERLEEEARRAAAALEAALAAAAGLPAETLAPVCNAGLEEGQRALAALEGRAAEARTAVERAEKGRAEARRRAREAQETYQAAVRKGDGLQAEARQAEERMHGLRSQAEVRLADVGRAWREPALAGDEAFVEALEGRHHALSGIAEEHAALERATAAKSRLEMRLGELARGLEVVPEEHRRPVAEAERLRAEAQAALSDSQMRRDEAKERLSRLADAQEHREGLNRRLQEAQRRRALYARLADLLGRSGLQAFLLDAAVQGISHLANETLARISGGQLQLQVRRQASARGEEEIVIQTTDLAFSEEPLDVQFLSGSQRFRTSVALAAAIGQYAGGGAGSVRSLIIDEGFGSLDSQGRQEMIDELRNLSQLVDRIIVVSHQEDFQDRTLFPTGYVLRKVGQRTEVERFV